MLYFCSNLFSLYITYQEKKADKKMKPKKAQITPERPQCARRLVYWSLHGVNQSYVCGMCKRVYCVLAVFVFSVYACVGVPIISVKVSTTCYLPVMCCLHVHTISWASSEITTIVEMNYYFYVNVAFQHRRSSQ